MQTHPVSAATNRCGAPAAQAPTKFALPLDGFIRQRDLLKVVPISSATLWRWCKAKKFPAPQRLGGPTSRITGWSVPAVRAWMAEQEDQANG